MVDDAGEQSMMTIDQSVVLWPELLEWSSQGLSLVPAWLNHETSYSQFVHRFHHRMGNNCQLGLSMNWWSFCAVTDVYKLEAMIGNHQRVFEQDWLLSWFRFTHSERRPDDHFIDSDDVAVNMMVPQMYHQSWVYPHLMKIPQTVVVEALCVGV